MKANKNTNYYVYILLCLDESEKVWPLEKFYIGISTHKNKEKVLRKHKTGFFDVTKDIGGYEFEEFVKCKSLNHALKLKDSLDILCFKDVEKKVGEFRRRRLRKKYVINKEQYVLSFFISKIFSYS